MIGTRKMKRNEIAAQLAAEAAPILAQYPQIGVLQGDKGTRYYATINGQHVEHMSAVVIAAEIENANA